MIEKRGKNDMKKKWIAGIILILILYFTVPKIVDIVKFELHSKRCMN